MYFTDASPILFIRMRRRFCHMRLMQILGVFAVIVSLLGCQSQGDQIKHLITELGSGDTPVQTKAVDTLVSIGNPAVDPLIVALKSADPGVRARVVEALGRIKDARSIEPLATELGDSDPTVRKNAVDALISIGKSAVEPLIAVLKGHDIQAKRQAASVLNHMKDTRAVEPFIAALGDGDVELKKAAAEALGNLKDARAVLPLIGGFKDNDAGVRGLVKDALVSIGAPAVEPLIDTLRDDATYVLLSNGSKLEIRQEAAETLGRIKDVRAVKPLITALPDNDVAFSMDASIALANIGVPAVEQLIAELRSSNTQAIRMASRTLGLIKDPRSVQALIAVIKYNDTYVGREAFLGLSDMGNVASSMLESFLLAALKDQDLKVIASCYDYFVWRGEVGTEPALIAALNLYGDAYGNYDAYGDVGIATCFLNCGNEKLKSAAISWGAGNAFQLITVPCTRAGIWAYFANYYCGKYPIRLGNQPFQPVDVYKLWRGTN